MIRRLSYKIVWSELWTFADRTLQQLKVLKSPIIKTH